jgi:hypothetical protein
MQHLLGRESPGDYVSEGLAEMLETPQTVQNFIAEINRAIRTPNHGQVAQFRNDLFALKQLLSNQAALGPAGAAATLQDAVNRDADIDARIDPAINANKAARTAVKAGVVAAAKAARPSHMICTYNEALAKFTNDGGYAGLSPNELVRLFSPPDSLYDYDLTTQEGYNAWFEELSAVPTRAYNASLDGLIAGRGAGTNGDPQQEAQAQGAANKKINDILNSTSDYLQTAIPKISFYIQNNSGTGASDLTYGVCGTNLPVVAGNNCDRLDWDATNFAAIKSRFSLPGRKFNDRGFQTEKGWQSVLNVMTLEDIKDFIPSGWSIHGDPGHAFNTTTHRTNFVVYKWLGPGASSAVPTCPIKIKSSDNLILGNSGTINIFVRYPDMALVYVNAGLNAGQINPPSPAGIYIDDKNKARILARNRIFRDNFDPLIANPAAAVFNISAGNVPFPQAATHAGTSPAINYRFNAMLDENNFFTVAFQAKIKLAVKAIFCEYMITNGLPGSYLQQGGRVSLHRRTKNKRMNQRQRRSKSKSKSMSMFKSAKRTFYRMNKRNKTSRQYH